MAEEFSHGTCANEFLSFGATGQQLTPFFDDRLVYGDAEAAAFHIQRQVFAHDRQSDQAKITSFTHESLPSDAEDWNPSRRISIRGTQAQMQCTKKAQIALAQIEHGTWNYTAAHEQERRPDCNARVNPLQCGWRARTFDEGLEGERLQ
jgi:hypothetical protein